MWTPEMIKAVVDRVKGLSWVGKTLLIALLPIVLLLIFTKMGRTLLGWFEQRTQKKVDDKSAKLDQQVTEQNIQVAEIKGQVKEIQKEEVNALDKAKQANAQQAVDFWNNRPTPPGK